MFMWVAIASALISFSGVVSYFMIQKLVFNQKVIAAQEKSINIIKTNIKSADELKKNVRIVNTSAALAALKANDNDEPAQVILDALPANPNSAALGASLQGKILSKPDVRVETMSVVPIQGVEDDTESSTSSSSTVDSSIDYPKIQFSYTVSVPAGRADLLWTILKDMERSIRAVNVDKISIENTTTRISMKVDAEAYYQPAANLDLKDVKP
jgi:hypothetical protein